MLKKARLFIVICLALGLSPHSLLGNAEKNHLILATATTGGTYYPVGVAIATLTTKNLSASHNILMTAISSAGSGENIQLLKNREADLAIIQSLFAAMARQGTGRYRNQPQEFFRSVSPLWRNVEHFVIQQKYVESGDMSDMTRIRNKNFSIGRRGSGTEMSGRIILEDLGFDPNRDFKLKFLGYTESAQALQNGRIVGMNIPAGPPASAVTQVYAALGKKGIRLLDFSDEQLEAVNSRYPVWQRAVVNAGTYPGQQQEIRTISQSNLLVAHEDISEDVVYRIVKNMYENLSYLYQVHQATKAIKLETAVSGLSIPLHPGALRYYQEMGLKIPENLK